MGEHTSWLAEFGPGIAAMACLAATYLGVWMVYFRARPLWYLVQAFAFLSWTVFFSLLFISAGPDPVLNRADIVPAVRNAELLGGLALFVWCILQARGVVVLTPPRVMLLFLLAALLTACAPVRDARWNWRDYQSVCFRWVDPCDNFDTTMRRL